MNSREWWREVKQYDKPYPHIKNSEIGRVIPKHLKDSWKKFASRQSDLRVNKMMPVMFPRDFFRFIERTKRKEASLEILSKIIELQKIAKHTNT